MAKYQTATFILIAVISGIVGFRTAGPCANWAVLTWHYGSAKVHGEGLSIVLADRHQLKVSNGDMLSPSEVKFHGIVHAVGMGVVYLAIMSLLYYTVRWIKPNLLPEKLWRNTR